jgi:hypothetical protein
MQISKRGFRKTLIIGALFIIVGVWMRELYRFSNEFWVISFGTCFIAFGQSFFYISITKVSSVWFGSKERSFSTSLGVLSLTLGNLVGFIIPAVWIKDGDAVDREDGKRKFENYMLF